eukprot:CAMPEP_0184329582 /NCGR_PEP_ID=MMETSP1049-20130417/144222_1 /TAXON_ID=77928 /ORGANISM="Proteomonas sulcata, Strain CCMP704" /LENGTH=319 /DNA_ID=CAMNT_0026651963 /DNA_START=27 /DNA_END=986 /DNA_ORIENTATION=+
MDEDTKPKELHKNVNDKTKLLIYVLKEKHKNESFWKPYLDILPENFSSPMFWTPEELDWLQGSHVKEAAKREKSEIQKQYYLLREHVFAADRKTFPKKSFSQKEWMWATALYDSRVIQLNRGTGTNVPTFTPLIDMVNCKESSDRSFIYFNPETRTADMFADRPVKLGEQVFETYGNKSNYEYLLYNGFVMEDNPNQCVYVEFPPPQGNVPGARSMSFCLGPDDIPRQVKFWARHAMMHRMSSESEAGEVIKHLEAHLHRYDMTQVQDDERILSEQGQDLGMHKMMALQMRIHEKRSLALTIQRLKSGEIPCCKVTPGK